MWTKILLLWIKNASNFVNVTSWPNIDIIQAFAWRKNYKYFTQGSQCTSQDLNETPPEYKLRALLPNQYVVCFTQQIIQLPCHFIMKQVYSRNIIHNSQKQVLIPGIFIQLPFEWMIHFHPSWDRLLCMAR